MNSSPRAPSARRQRGVIMVVALVTLVVLLIGAAAMIRSMSGSLSAAGAYGFKRDMANQAPLAFTTVQGLMNGGALNSELTRWTANKAINYSATALATSPEGIPTALLGADSAFANVGTASDISGAVGSGITIRYIIDRLCTAEGMPSESTCMVASPAAPTGGSVAGANPPTPTVVYRLTVRVSGPRSAQSFFQSTFSSRGTL